MHFVTTKLFMGRPDARTTDKQFQNFLIRSNKRPPYECIDNRAFGMHNMPETQTFTDSGVLDVDMSVNSAPLHNISCDRCDSDKLEQGAEEEHVADHIVNDLVDGHGRDRHGCTSQGMFKLSNRKGENSTMEKQLENELRKLIRKQGLWSLAKKTILPQVMGTAKTLVEDNILIQFSIGGHYDSYISKTTTKVLYKYLRKKYPNIMINVDDNFALCDASIEKVKKAVTAFPELVNRTIAPGIYWVDLDKIGTKMIVIKQQIVGDNDISSNGIKSTINMFKTTVVFIGPNMKRWSDHIRSQINSICSRIVSRSMSHSKVRVNVLSGDDSTQSSDVSVRPMEFLVFPKKAALLKKVETFLANGSLYQDNGIPHRLGLLFEGPRGVGKTSFAYALAQYFDMGCVSVDLSYFDSKNGTNAFGGDRVVYIIDEIDAQLPKFNEAEEKDVSTETEQKMRERLIKLLKAMDEMGNGCIIIATTNYPERLDTKLKRSGRFTSIIHFDDLDEKYARKMVAARDLNPDDVLKDAVYPINPSHLEECIVEEILRNGGINEKDRISVDELVSGDIASETSGGAASMSRSDEYDDDDDVPGDENEPSNATIIASDEGSAVMTEDDDDSSGNDESPAEPVEEARDETHQF